MLAARVFARGLLAPGPMRFPFSATTLSASKTLTMEEFGSPDKVLKMKEDKPPSCDMLGENEVLINILAAPINPSDINTIQGTYPLRPELPGTPGHEGVGIVAAIGSKVTRLRPGDRVVPIEHSQGTWRTHGIFKDRHWYRVPHDLPIATAATMVINPPTALRLLEEYVSLQEGDTIIQTGATSAVGKYVMQLAREKGLHNIAIIRDRPDRAEIEQDLKELGASMVVTPSELKGAMATWEHSPPKLALDCIGGDAAAEMAKTLDHGGTLVVYGAMSQQPLCVPPGLLIFKDIRVRGFWLTGGYAKMRDGWKAKEQLVDRICALFRQKKIKPIPVHCVPLQQWEEALAAYFDRSSESPSVAAGKVILTNYEEDVCM